MNHAHRSPTATVTSLAALVALCFETIVRPVLAEERPLLSAATERSSPGEVRPSGDLVRVVLGSIDKDDIQQLDECLSDEGRPPADFASLLSAVKIPLGAGHTLWFVRPTLRPYCFGLYGAHSFRYFFIEEQRAEPHYRLLFQNGGDFFRVYRQQSHGLNDIEATGCIASECSSARMSFDGREYRPVRCTVTTWDDRRREVTTSRRCASDGWRDDQSSGFAPRSGG